MAIVNRDLDSSEKKIVVNCSYRAVNTGQTIAAFVVPCASELESVRSVCQGLSGAPIISLYKGAFISGAGLTLTAVGVSGIVLSALGTSGVQGQSILPASGSTSIQFNAGDALMLMSTGANTAADSLALQLVFKKLQDIVQMNGQS